MKLTRRRFVGISLKSVAPLMLIGPLKLSQDTDRPLKAAVLEFANAETLGAIGAEIMIRKAGFEVVKLTPEILSGDISPNAMVVHYSDHSQHDEIIKREKNAKYTFSAKPDIKDFDLIFFGSFVNQSQVYHDFIRLYAGEIRSFVKSGGIVMEMNQWARYSFLHPDYLPDGMSFSRETWSGTDELTLEDKDHPLISQWIGQNGQQLFFPKQRSREGRYFEGRRSWESISNWKGMKVLIGANGGYIYKGRAALLEGSHGKGKYLFSSLWLDKLFDKQGISIAPKETLESGHRFFSSLYDYVLSNRAGKNPTVIISKRPPEPIIGPMLGHIDHQQAIIWLRGREEGVYNLKVWKKGLTKSEAVSISRKAEAKHDYCMQWSIEHLSADSTYFYIIEHNGNPIWNNGPYLFETPLEPHLPADVTVAFGSCVDQEGRFSDLWREVGNQGAEAMVLLGDTPYIDSTIKEHQQVKHRHFLSQEGPAELCRKIPFWGTWDDHDFGANASDGTIHNRESTREVFLDYRAQSYYGEHNKGIYSNFRRGPLEVFLIDTRYFSGTEPSFADPARPTLIGTQQWEWLKKKLKASDAPFKLLSCGMTWDAKVGTGETDDWSRYIYEREAIIDFIGQENISGVMLIGGDIHCTQVMKYRTEERIGYPLHHIVTSPMHERIIKEQEGLNHPGLLYVKAEPNTFLKIRANSNVKPATLTADIINMSGQSIYSLSLQQDMLSAKKP